MINMNFHKKSISAVIAVLSLALFATIALIVQTGTAGGFDDIIRFRLYDMRTEWINSLMKIITFSANWQIIAGSCLALLILPKTRDSFGIPVSLSSLSAWSIQETLKLLFQRLRPADILPLVSETSYSFPSGHAATGLVFYSVLLLSIYRPIKNKTARFWLAGLAVFWIIMIGISRIYLGVHYPTDVLAGWSLGIFLLLVFKYAADRFTGNDI